MCATLCKYDPQVSCMLVCYNTAYSIMYASIYGIYSSATAPRLQPHPPAPMQEIAWLCEGVRSVNAELISGNTQLTLLLLHLQVALTARSVGQRPAACMRLHTSPTTAGDFVSARVRSMGDMHGTSHDDAFQANCTGQNGDACCNPQQGDTIPRSYMYVSVGCLLVRADTILRCQGRSTPAVDP